MLVTVSVYGTEETPTPTGEPCQAKLLLAGGAPGIQKFKTSFNTDWIKYIIDINKSLKRLKRRNPPVLLLPSFAAILVFTAPSCLHLRLRVGDARHLERKGLLKMQWRVWIRIRPS